MLPLRLDRDIAELLTPGSDSTPQSGLSTAEFLRTRGFHDLESQRILGNLWLTAARILRTWITSGKIYALTRQLGWPIRRSAVIEQYGDDVVNELIDETLSRVLERFKRDISTPQPIRSADTDLLNYFITICVQEYPNSYRRVRTLINSRDTPADRIALTEAAEGRQTLTRQPSFETWWSVNDEIREALRSQPPILRHILGYIAEGYTAEETADRLCVSRRSVEARIYRFRMELTAPPTSEKNGPGRHRNINNTASSVLTRTRAPALLDGGTFAVRRGRRGKDSTR